MLSLSACGTLGAIDPRCESLCIVKEPAVSGAYDICSQASAERCKQDCSKRIEKQASLCATCQLERAQFYSDTSSTPTSCTGGACTMSGRTGSCTYQEDDKPAHDNCSRQVSPRREVECIVYYRPVMECASLCDVR